MLNKTNDILLVPAEMSVLWVESAATDEGPFSPLPTGQ